MANLLYPLLLVAMTNAQFVPPFVPTAAPYGPASPFGRQASPFGPTFSPFGPNIGPSLGPNVAPFGPAGRPLAPSAYNNPYYNQAGPATPILTYSNDQNIDGSYAFSFTTADGKQVQESGYLRDAFVDNAGEPQGIHVVQGSYAYIAPDGTPIQVSYVADENGFRPQGVHIPADGKTAPLSVAGAPAALRTQDPSRFTDPYYSRYNRINQNERVNPANGYDRYNRYNPTYNQVSPYNARYNPFGTYNSVAATPRVDNGEKKN